MESQRQTHVHAVRGQSWNLIELSADTQPLNTQLLSRQREFAIALILLAGFIQTVFSADLILTPNAHASDDGKRTVTIRAQVPVGTDTVYLVGNCPELGNWYPSAFAMKGDGTNRTASLRLPAGTRLEFKFTLGSWEREGLAPSGLTGPNNLFTVETNAEVTVIIPGFKKEIADSLDDWKGSGVLGRLEYWKRVPSKFLTPTRNIAIWLPPGYDENSTNRYAVLYMHDGQNLFDPRTSYAGVDWGVDEAIVRGMKAGHIPPMIVVGVWCTEQRLREYSPWHSGTNYARFLIEELLPQINAKFRTRTGPENTATMGSSMGGLISFWLAWKHPDVFGSAGCLSSALTWDGKILGKTLDETPLLAGELTIAHTFPGGVRVYFDYGTLETMGTSFEAMHIKLGDWLTAQGLKDGKDFVVRKIPGAKHNEAAWRTRLDEPLNFLFGHDPARRYSP